MGSLEFPAGKPANEGTDYAGSNPSSDHTGSDASPNNAGSNPSSDLAGSEASTNDAGSYPSSDHADSNPSSEYTGSNPSSDHAGSDIDANAGPNPNFDPTGPERNGR